MEEHNTATLKERLEAMKRVQEAGYKIGIHFDPIIITDNWKEEYRELINYISRIVSPENIAWWSLFMGDSDRNTLMFLPLLFLAPVGAMIVQLAISRTREYGADYSAGVITKNPKGLANALRKLENFATANPVKGNAATAHLFIINPFKADAMSKLFSTHPSTKERIQKLEELEKKLNC